MFESVSARDNRRPGGGAGRHAVREGVGLVGVQRLVGLDRNFTRLAVFHHFDRRPPALLGGDERAGDVDAALAAVDRQPLPRVHADAGQHVRHDPAVEQQRAGGDFINPVLGPLPVAAHLDRGGVLLARGRGGDEGGGGRGVPAHVQDAAAGVIRAEQPPAVVVRRVAAGAEGERRLDHLNSADLPVFYQVRQLPRQRVAPPHVRLHHEDAVLVGGVEDRHRLGVVDADGLLAQNVLARPAALDGPLGVLGVGRGDVDRVHVAALEHSLVAAVRRPAELGGELVGLVLTPRRDGGELAPLGLGQRLGEGLGDVPGRKDAPAEGSAHGGHGSTPYARRRRSVSRPAPTRPTAAEAGSGTGRKRMPSKTKPAPGRTVSSVTTAPVI